MKCDKQTVTTAGQTEQIVELHKCNTTHPFVISKNRKSTLCTENLIQDTQVTLRK